MKLKVIFNNNSKIIEAISYKDIINQVREIFKIHKKETISIQYKDPFDPDEQLMPLADQAKFEGMRIRAEEIEEDEF